MAEQLPAITTQADLEAFDRMCLGKEQYPSEAAAVAAIKLLAKERSHKKGSTLVAYACRFCRQWHFGH